MSWKGQFTHWCIRLVCVMMLFVSVNILSGASGWEEDFDPPLSIREKKLVRSGVLFEMCFQAGFWATNLIIAEMVTSKVRATQCLCMAALMLFCGPYGLPTWLHYGDGEDDPHYKQEIIAGAINMCYGIVGILGLAAYFGFSENEKDENEKDANEKEENAKLLSMDENENDKTR